MNIDDAKQWLKDHKKEVIIASASAAGTAAIFLIKEKKIKGIRAGLRLSLEFLNGEGGDEFGPRYFKKDFYTNVNMHKPGFTVGDLGKVGKELMKLIPSLTKDTPLNQMNANYSLIK